MSILLKFQTLKWNISRTIWHIEVGDGSFFPFFTVFHLSLTFFRPEVPFNSDRLLRHVLVGPEPPGLPVYVTSYFACCLVYKINWQSFYLGQLLKFHPFDWLIKISVFKPRAWVLTTKWYRSNQCLVLTSVRCYCFSFMNVIPWVLPRIPLRAISTRANCADWCRVGEHCFTRQVWSKDKQNGKSALRPGHMEKSYLGKAGYLML